jgi:hypothetical protein
MATARREVTKLLGASMVAPLMPALGTGTARVPGLSLLGQAELEVQQVGEVSAETAKTMLEVQGMHSLYDDPEQFEELRMALTRALRDHTTLRAFHVPDDVEPVLTFEA